MMPDDYQVVPVLGRVEAPARRIVDSQGSYPDESKYTDDEDDVDLYATAASTGFAVVAYQEHGLYSLQPGVLTNEIREVTVSDHTAIYQWPTRDAARAALAQFKRQSVLGYLGR